MKRFLAVLLAITIVFTLSSCGGETEASSSEANVASGASVETSQPADPGAYVIPTAWNEASINDGTYSYVTAQAEAADGNVSIAGDYLIGSEHGGDHIILTRTALDGTKLDGITIPFPEKSDTVDQSVSFYQFGTDCLWYILTTCVILDQETGKTDGGTYVLKKCDLQGNELVSIPLDEAYGLSKEAYLSGLSLSPDDIPMLCTSGGAFFLNPDGTILSELDLGEAWGLDSFFTDSQGRTYGFDMMEGNLYTMDWENHALGQVAFSTKQGSSFAPGGEDYDLLLVGSAKLWGLDFDTGTQTEILSWEDCDLAGMVGDIAVLDADTWLITIYDALTNGQSILTLSRVPADEVPEKTILTMAIPMSPSYLEWGGTWVEALDAQLAAQMNSFNRMSNTYQVEVVTFSSAQELQLMMVSGDAPDVIHWSSTAWLEDTPSLELYAKKGYLVDLEPLFQSDEELSLDDFIPNVLSLAMERTNGLYAMPVDFYLWGMTAKAEYAGTEPGWTVSEMLSVAESLPEDTALWSYMSQNGLLQSLMQSLSSHFVNVDAGTCNFQTQEFYDILTLCRDYCPAEITETYVEPAESLLGGIGTMGRLGQFIVDQLPQLESEGRVVKGCPGVPGNGYQMIYYSEFSICALSDNLEGAWEFVRSFYGYNFQYNNAGVMSPVRVDALNDKEDWFVEINGMCTMEESLEARKIICGVEDLRNGTSPVLPMVLEEATAFFTGDKTARQVAEILENRVRIYLSEQS